MPPDQFGTVPLSEESCIRKAVDERGLNSGPVGLADASSEHGRRSCSERSLSWLGGQLNEFLGRQASVESRSTHRHRPEGAMIASFMTIGAGVTQHFWTSGHDKPLVFVRRLSQGHIGHGTCPNVSRLTGWVLARRHGCFVAVPLRCIHRAGRTTTGTAAQVGQDDRLALASDYLLERCRTG